MTHGESCGDTWHAMCQHARHTLKAINMGSQIQFVWVGGGGSKLQSMGVARRRRRKGEEKGRKGEEKWRKRKEKERKKEEKKKEEERKKKEEKEGVSRSEETQTAKDSELRYER